MNPTTQTNHPHPWRAEGRRILDANGRKVAKCETPQDAKLLAQSPTAMNALAALLDSHQRGPDAAPGPQGRTFWRDVRALLVASGRDDLAEPDGAATLAWAGATLPRLLHLVRQQSDRDPLLCELTALVADAWTEPELTRADLVGYVAEWQEQAAQDVEF